VQSDPVHSDGLRALKVNSETAPAMAEVRDKGVNCNSDKQKRRGFNFAVAIFALAI
jgi:hypothetical protein